ncbi:MAG: penicillin-binding protein 2, partial [Bdellovibrionales bacterium]|nr:penicillin-binding protein 2 [Bdellovibrionales bacterium]
EPRRYYPYKSAGSALIGRVGVDGLGLSGIEAAYERRLHEPAVKNAVARDALGNMRADARFDFESFALPKGRPLKLTIDADIQVILNKALMKGLKDANAKRAIGVMVDSVTGEILAMDQVPTKNFNWERVQQRKDLINHVVESVFEPGSTMKPFVASLVLDEGLASPNEIIPCENGAYRFHRRTINDVHGNAALSVREVVVRSSNIGMTKLGVRLGAQNLYNGLRKFGFGSAVSLGLPGETPGILRKPERWAAIDVATHSFGQGMAVTPLQLVRAMSVVANGGYLNNLTIIPSEQPQAFEQVLHEETAYVMQDILIDVVESEHGTGKRAHIDGIRVGGKTGTAQKAKTDGRGYQEGAYLASFLGFADAREQGVENPLVLLIAIDEPNTTSIYGGTLAGPVFQEVMSKTITELSRRQFLTTPKSRHDETGSTYGIRRISYPAVS